MCEGMVTRSPEYRKSIAQAMVMTPEKKSSFKEESCYPGCIQNINGNQEQEEPTKEPHEEERITDASDATTESIKSMDDEVDIELSQQLHTLDVEEIGLNGTATHIVETVDTHPSSVVVDYEEDEIQATKRLENSTSCAPDACRTMNGNQSTLLSTTVRDENGQNPSRIRRTSRGISNSERLYGIISTNGDGSIVLNRNDRGLSRDSNSHTVVEDMKAVVVPEPEPERCSKVHKLCLCEVRLHKSMESCWLVASGNVYDVTGVVSVHPAGPKSILRKAGGPDCTQDMKFHSKMARKILQKCFIGKLQPCGPSIQEESKYQFAHASCTIM